MEAKKLVRLLAEDVLNVPEEGEGENLQNEDWWIENVGGLPPASIPAGDYVCVFDTMLEDETKTYQPDAQVEMFGSDSEVLNLYKIE